MNLIDLQAFVAVAEAGSVSGAARNLALPKSSISRRVARLEGALGLSLVTRGGRRVGLTDAGRRLHKRTAGLFREFRDAQQELIDSLDQPTGTLRLAVPHAFGVTLWLTHLLTSYCRAHPRVDVDVTFADGSVDLIREGYDVAIRARTGNQAGLTVRRLGIIKTGLYASQEYVAEHGVPADITALADHKCVSIRGAVEDGSWRLIGPEGQEHIVQVRSVLMANDFSMTLQAILAGAGIGVIPRTAAKQLETDGKVVRALPGWHIQDYPAWLLWPSGRQLPPLVRAFVDHAIRYSSEHGVVTSIGIHA